MAVSNLKSLTYFGLADEYGVTLCHGCGGSVNYSSHWFGTSNASLGVVHWSRTRMTRPGLMTFLALIADIVYSLNRMGDSTRSVYLRSRWAYEEAQKHGVYLRMPLVKVELRRAVHYTSMWAASNPALAEEIRAWAGNRRKK